MYSARLKLESQNLKQCSVYTVYTSRAIGGMGCVPNSGTIASNSQNRSSPKYNDILLVLENIFALTTHPDHFHILVCIHLPISPCRICFEHIIDYAHSPYRTFIIFRNAIKKKLKCSVTTLTPHYIDPQFMHRLCLHGFYPNVFGYQNIRSKTITQASNLRSQRESDF
jgi:hypothetical protein